MKTLYLDCSMGAAGDMFTGALLELLPSPEPFLEQMNALGLPGVKMSRESAVKCGITGTHIRVIINGEEEASHDVHHMHANAPHSHSCNEDHTHHSHHDNKAHSHALELHDCEGTHQHSHEQKKEGHSHASHSHTGMPEIKTLIQSLALPAQVKTNAIAVYLLIAQAEAHVHGKPVEHVHFHEVGTMDAVADVIGACLLMHTINPDVVFASTVHVGSGQVHCAHGILPVPAPATAYILQGVPTYSGDIKGELCTPTGAALLKHFVSNFGAQPVISTVAIGYGMGTKDFAAANCMRALLGNAQNATGADEISEICCNLDDITGEELAFAQNILFENGALDVYTIPIQMKKNRPAHMLCCICTPDATDKLASLILQHTSSFGVRVSHQSRYTLQRSLTNLQTPWGNVQIKHGAGHGASKFKPEYEDIARIAKENSLPLNTVMQLVKEKASKIDSGCEAGSK